jgi:hypothetical protein
VRAAIQEEETCDLISGLMGLLVVLQASPGHWGGRAVVHIFKGGGKNPLLFESYRPIGIGHGLARVADEIWNIRNGATAREYAAPEQACGRMGSLEAVAARADRLQLRGKQGLPTAVLYSDIEFGFDGGRHAQMLDRAWGAGIEDWVWTAEMLRHDKMIIMDPRGQMEPLSTGGVGAGQGKRRSPDLFNL